MLLNLNKKFVFIKRIRISVTLIFVLLIIVSICIFEIVKTYTFASERAAQRVINSYKVSGIPDIPFRVESDTIIPLRNLINDDLQQQLVKKINANSKWKRLVDNRRMAVGVVDLREQDNIKYARVNGNVMMYAASLPKIAILLAAMDAIEKGELVETSEIKSELRQMISKSSNMASTKLIDMLGYDKISSVLTDPKYEFYDEDYGGGLWVGKRYAKYGERRPDPLRGITHGATVTQVCRFYYLMVFGKLINYERSKQMLEYMADPELHHKFVSVLEQTAPAARLYRKSGTWKNFHSDSILVWGPERRYILVALIEDTDGEKILRDLVISTEEIFKNY